MRRNLLWLTIWSSLVACQEEFRPLTPPTDPPRTTDTKPTCQPPTIEKNIIGTWHFESNRSPDRTIRGGAVTFTAQGHIVDPDSLFENSIDLGVFVDKRYTTDGTYGISFPGYTGKIFRVDLLLKNNTGVIWPLYVASNECNKIVIYQLASYGVPVPEKFGFTLTR